MLSETVISHILECALRHKQVNKLALEFDLTYFDDAQ